MCGEMLPLHLRSSSAVAAAPRGTQDQYPAHRVEGGGSLEGLMKFLEGQKISCTW